jgi:hypothetical protein
MFDRQSEEERLKLKHYRNLVQRQMIRSSAVLSRCIINDQGRRQAAKIAEYSALFGPFGGGRPVLFQSEFGLAAATPPVLFSPALTGIESGQGLSASARVGSLHWFVTVQVQALSLGSGISPAGHPSADRPRLRSEGEVGWRGVHVVLCVVCPQL